MSPEWLNPYIKAAAVVVRLVATAVRSKYSQTKMATAAVAKCLLELKKATLLDAASTLYDAEKRRVKAKTASEEADAQKRISEASMILKEREAEVRKRRAEARELESNAKKSDSEAKAILLRAQAEAFEKLTDAAIKLRNEGGTAHIDPQELLRLLAGAEKPSSAREAITEQPDG